MFYYKDPRFLTAAIASFTFYSFLNIHGKYVVLPLKIILLSACNKIGVGMAYFCNRFSGFRYVERSSFVSFFNVISGVRF